MKWLHPFGKTIGKTIGNSITTPLSKLRGNRFVFPLAALAALAMFLISESSYQQATSTFDALRLQGATRTNIQTLLRNLVDTETGQRGYLLTSRQEYLDPYKLAQSRVAQTLDWLNEHYRDDPEVQELMKQLTLATHNRQAVAAETIREHDAGNHEKALALIASNYGREQMSIVRELCDRLVTLETNRIAAARARMDRTLLLNRLGVSAMTALSLLALYMYLRQSTALVRQREEQRRLVQAERDQLESQAMRRTEQLTGLARHLERAREDERNHLARELHDELGAVLTAAKLDVARLKSRLGDVKPDVQERVRHLNEGLNSGIALKRRIIEDLRPSSLINLGLVQALDILISEWTRRTSVKVDAHFEPVQLRASAELTVYRLVQEALTNVAKYAAATEVRVRVSSSTPSSQEPSKEPSAQSSGQTRVHVSVRDNGRGFDAKAPRGKTHGLLGMEYRIETEGGVLTVSSTPGQGTLVEADLPESADLSDGQDDESQRTAA